MTEGNTASSVGNEFTYFNVPSIIICSLGVISNVLLLVAFIKDPLKCFRNSGTYLVMNLSVSDCLMCLISLAGSITPRLGLNTAFQFFLYWVVSVSFVTITSISIDRFLMVAYPIKHRILMKGKVVILWITAIWIMSCIIPAFLKLSDIRETSGRMALCLFNVIIVFLSSVMYSSTYYKLKRHPRNMALQNSTESRAQEIRILKEKRFLKTIIIIACIAFVCILPFLIFHLFDFSIGLGEDNLASTMSYRVFSYIYVVNFAVNPLIYILRLPKYRKTFYLLYCKMSTCMRASG